MSRIGLMFSGYQLDGVDVDTMLLFEDPRG